MKKLLFMLVLAVASVSVLAGCSGGNALVIWVGSESQEFYAEKMDLYVEEYNSTHEEKFPYKISVLAADTGTAAATFLDDPEAGADIFTVAHDNLGKLTAGSSAIAPVTNPDLLAQIAADNPDPFLEVIKASVGGVEYTFGVPYVAQDLVLYYNTDYITATQVETWEGILDAAIASNKQALSLTGTDGFNNSFLVLARNAETNESTLKIYEGGVQEECYARGDDTVAVMKWGQRFFTHPNGAKAPTDSGWETELHNVISLSVIAGSWDFGPAKAALGSKLGVAVLPTFTITEDDAYGTVEAGTVFQSGTFVDTKMFVMKKNSEKAAYLQDIMLYLSSKEMQEESFEEAENLPAYKNAPIEFEAFLEDTVEAELARAQVEMFQYGMPQPFGYSTKFNTYYYSKGAPDLIMDILENTDDLFTEDSAILAQLEIIETIWKTGIRPE
ncbi:MAG: extracellular solute-binding protein [Bacilli bacterium]|nr:extracellular solute-binding protein [Bacilli bacterium]MBN2695929.1 extracellular solute-binding protein [Bacilli bacterium]